MLIEELLIGLRAEIVQRRVTATPIVERLDVEKHVCLRLVAGVVHTVMHQLALQRAEEAFHRRIVVPTPGTVHTGADAMVLWQQLVRLVSVLAALIRVVDEASIGPTLKESHLQGRCSQTTRHPMRHRPTDNEAGVQIEDGGQVEPPSVWRCT